VRQWANRGSTPLLLATCVAVWSATWTSGILADDSVVAKEPEVATVGSGAYVGPLPEELAKLAKVRALPLSVPSPAKDSPHATFTVAGIYHMTEAELAKLAALPSAPVALPALPTAKPAPMQVPKDGTSVLTAGELEKLAMLLATAPPSPSPASSSPSPKTGGTR
jgi:hypothetical protein